MQPVANNDAIVAATFNQAMRLNHLDVMVTPAVMLERFKEWWNTGDPCPCDIAFFILLFIVFRIIAGPMR